ncbi:MAG: hypothetical protein L6V93_08425 [Clostridiales bacterium]|nr:MAG: hypothetical protein L6V93_08425 [Clostridiales bacterium]
MSVHTALIFEIGEGYKNLKGCLSCGGEETFFSFNGELPDKLFLHITAV